MQASQQSATDQEVTSTLRGMHKQVSCVPRCSICWLHRHSPSAHCPQHVAMLAVLVYLHHAAVQSDWALACSLSTLSRNQAVLSTDCALQLGLQPDLHGVSIEHFPVHSQYTNEAVSAWHAATLPLLPSSADRAPRKSLQVVLPKCWH